MSPFLVAIVGLAKAWIYMNGVLCYTVAKQLRILGLHRAASQEIVVNVYRLLDEAIKQPRTKRKYTFLPLYYSHDIVSCLCTYAKHTEVGSASWLVVFNPSTGKIITAKLLESTDKIFVRNNDNFLYYGTNSNGKWVMRGFDLVDGTWLNQTSDIPAEIGSGVDSTVSFGIFNGFFYGVSNQTSLEAVVVDWVSYYTCFRFPLT